MAHHKGLHSNFRTAVVDLGPLALSQSYPQMVPLTDAFDHRIWDMPHQPNDTLSVHAFT